MLGKDLLEVFQESWDTAVLLQTRRSTVISLIPKKGDSQDLKNWRPVSLMCQYLWKALSAFGFSLGFIARVHWTADAQIKGTFDEGGFPRVSCNSEINGKLTTTVMSLGILNTQRDVHLLQETVKVLKTLSLAKAGWTLARLSG